MSNESTHDIESDENIDSVKKDTYAIIDQMKMEQHKRQSCPGGTGVVTGSPPNLVVPEILNKVALPPLVDCPTQLICTWICICCVP